MKGTKEFSDKQERMIAEYLGWKQVTGSGSRNFHPGDVVGDEWLGECKTHVNSGHRITFNFRVWDKIAEEAVSQLKYPVLFADDGSQLLENTFCLIAVPQASLSEFNPAADYTEKSSISRSLGTLHDTIVKNDTPYIFSRNGVVMVILSLVQFEAYILS